MGDLIAGWLLLVLGVAGCAGGVAWMHGDVRLMRRGVRVEADVVGVREHEDGDGDVHHYPIVRFTAPDGTEVEGETYARVHEYHAPATIGVVYDPRKPRRFREDPGIVGPLVLLAVSVAAAAVACRCF
ncbi:DUF3592 domain-containing protein [Streptomyces sp. NPDC003036]|uniref:DUF3592 domain-containing protein n=1 Tax=Streptomyces sp. NPDC003036 TaxID=3154442 RepID=UPI0033BD3F5D